jgi:small-conductance mechanosensitive channel
LAIIATVVFALALRLIFWLRSLVVSRAVRATQSLAPTGIGIGEWKLYDSGQVARAASRGLNFACFAASLFGTYLWLAYVLTLFVPTREIGTTLGGHLLNSVGNLVDGALAGIPGLFTVLIILIVARLLTRPLNAFFSAVETGAVNVTWVHADTAAPTRRIATVMLWLCAVIVAYPYLPGSNTDVFKGVSVFVGVLISLGSSGLVSQLMSGLVLMYSRAFKVGEFVRVGHDEGTVVELGMLSTKIANVRGEITTIPNLVMVKSSTTNFSRGENGVAIAASTAVSIRHHVPWRRVHGLLLAAANQTVGLQQEPAPYVVQTALGEIFVKYELNVQVIGADHCTRVLARLHENIQDRFHEAGLWNAPSQADDLELAAREHLESNATHARGRRDSGSTSVVR